MISTMNEISMTVKRLRRLAGFTQKELADISGVGKTSVFDIEKGKETVQLKTLLCVCEVLNIKIEIVSPVNFKEA